KSTRSRSFCFGRLRAGTTLRRLRSAFLSMVVARGLIDGDWGGGRSNVGGGNPRQGWPQPGSQRRARPSICRGSENEAARIATAGCATTACSTAGVVPPKASLVEQLNEFNLESA